MKIRVRYTSGQMSIDEIEINSDSSILQLKELIFSKNTNADVEKQKLVFAGRILENNKLEVKPLMIQPVNEIKSLGTFKVKINLHPEVQAEIKIKVAAAETVQ